MLGLAARAQAMKARVLSLARLQIELATIEMKRKAKWLVIAAGLAVVALVAVLYAIGFVFAAIAAGIAEALPLWASLLIVAFLLLVTAAVLLFAAIRMAKKAGRPRPVETVEEARETARELRDA